MGKRHDVHTSPNFSVYPFYVHPDSPSFSTRAPSIRNESKPFSGKERFGIGYLCLNIEDFQKKVKAPAV
jgi:hypothetical protein